MSHVNSHFQSIIDVKKIKQFAALWSGQFSATQLPVLTPKCRQKRLFKAWRWCLNSPVIHKLNSNYLIMYKIDNPIVVNGCQTEGQCRNNSYYIRFNDEDIDELSAYAFDMGYALEPEVINTDPEHPMRFRVICKNNPTLYGWISKVIEKKDDQWQDIFLYGFYRHGKFRNKYPITINLQSHQMRGILKRNAGKNPKLKLYFRILFGILSLEPEVNPLDFIFSWLWSLKFKHI